MNTEVFNARATLATAQRVLGQLRRDPRTVALLLVVPCVLITLLAWVFNRTPAVFDSIGAPLLGVFPFISMFLVTSVATLRERTSGTLERLLTMPIGKLDILAGYALAFGGLAIVQALLVSAVSLGPLGLHVRGAAWTLVVVALLDALLGMALGLFVSAFAATEFQAVQFLPAIVLPQVLLCGLISPREDMATPLQWVARALPLTYAVDAMQEVTVAAALTSTYVRDVSVIAACVVVALLLGAVTLRRRTA